LIYGFTGFRIERVPPTDEPSSPALGEATPVSQTVGGQT
jgi:hypothetical protein